jgi:class 3 adenylate cyclase/tetratricopeptide (TPR) repeat protein
MTCPSCGTENPPGARFCLECGTPLDAQCDSCGGPLPAVAKFCPTCGAPAVRRPAPTVRTEERRIVTILFVDLVGFTERSDLADPEDVRRILVPFHTKVKDDLERFGGTLDKFIGDAVMGVFGAPVAHEDDPVRAVRAALQILRSIDELRVSDPDIAVRIAVNTGEAVVAFGAGPQVGEAVAGDVVNTTSRMQSLAPRDAVVVGEATLRALRDEFVTERLAPSTVKGKSEPITVWRVLGEGEHATGVVPTTFVGREDELDLLGDLFERAVRSGVAQLVTLVGEPGIGKTRLVGEFRQRVAGGAWWLAGRCVPYGDVVRFAPVSGTIREVAGIASGVDPTAARRALSVFVEGIEAETSEREWLRSRLEPLLGIVERDEEQTIPVREIADAWARVLGFAAAERPLVLQIDDLHWAEPAFLEIVERLADALSRRRVLLLCTARPELLEREEPWGAGRTNATTIGLEALSETETGQLLTTLLTQAAMDAPTRESLLARAGGNPLYALEFARMLGEQTAPPERMAMPESVKAVIAARLDAIPTELRALVQDASIGGSSFWPGMLSDLGGRTEADVAESMTSLVRRGLVQPAAASAIRGEPEFVFTHGLIGEVAYERIPRAQRALRHRAVGEWMERVSAGRADGLAETLARHYATAVELAEAAGDRENAESARRPALRWLTVATERATRIDAAGAFAFADRAVGIAPAGSRERAAVLTNSARMGRRSGRIEAAEVANRYREALAIHRALGDARAVGDTLTSLGSHTAATGDTAGGRALLAEAVETLEALPPGSEIARAYAFRAEDELFAGRSSEAVAFAERALDLLRSDVDDELVVMCLHIRGDSRCAIGDERGLEDLREALRISEASANVFAIVTSENYLAEWQWAMGEPQVALATFERALELAERRGAVDRVQWTKAGGLWLLLALGEWDRAKLWSDDLLAVGRDRLDEALFAVARTVRSQVALRRGLRADADSPEELLALARPVEELQALVPALLVAAELSIVDGDVATAADHLRELERVTRGVAAQYRESQLTAIVRACVEVGELELADRMANESDGVVLRDRINVLAARAVVFEAKGAAATAADAYADVAVRWQAFGDPFEEAQARMGRARCDPMALTDRLRAEEILRSLGVPV